MLDLRVPVEMHVFHISSTIYKLSIVIMVNIGLPKNFSSKIRLAP